MADHDVHDAYPLDTDANPTLWVREADDAYELLFGKDPTDPFDTEVMTPSEINELTRHEELSKQELHRLQDYVNN